MSVPLGDVAEFVRGITFKPGDVVTTGALDSVVCLRTKNVQTEVDLDDLLAVPSEFIKRKEQYLRSGDVLISSANSWNLVGKCCWIPELPWPASFGGFVTVLRGKRETVDQRYLFHWFSSERTQQLLRSFGQKTTNISNLNLSRCRSMAFPIRPIEEQRRIAAVLNAAEALRAKRRQALAKVDSLTQAIFIDMFGDLANNLRGWPMRRVSEFVDSFQTGKSVAAGPDDVPGGYRVLKVSAVTSRRYLPEESKPVPSSYAPPSSHVVQAGDLLLSRANTTELVGACAYVDATPENHLLPDKLWRFIWRMPREVEPLFMWHLLQDRRVRREIGDLATGSSGSMKNISQKKFMQLEVPIPPLERQEKFVTRLHAVRSIASSQMEEELALDALFASLQQRAFRGEL